MDSQNFTISQIANISYLEKDFCIIVKGMINLLHGIKEYFLTEISPLLLPNNTCGFNIAVNVSFKKELAGLSGLTHTDVDVALKN